MRADRLVGIADRDRNFDAEIEYLAAIRPRLVGVAPYVKLLRRAADVDGDRLERELGLGRRLGGFGLFRRSYLGNILGASRRIELWLHVGFGGLELRLRFRSLRLGLLPSFLGLRLGLVRLGVGERLVGVGEFSLGASVELFQFAKRGVQRCGIPRRGRSGG